MMKGHLAVARELYQAGEQTAAQPHFGHPLHEHYEPLESAFEARGVEHFEGTLEALVEEVREGGEWGDHADAYAAAVGAIDAAMQDVDGELREDVTFQSRVQLALLRQAMHEYEEAVDDGQFVNVLEYQDSRGFVLTAKALLEVQSELYDDEAYGELLAAYEDALAAWPSAVAPEAPVMTPGELSAAMFKLEAELGEY
ncbi:hypothetical protein ACFPTY_06150 [Halomonas beimenensis]|uniref:Putative secreted protein n=1 Tax=Halomonas beimenensis TaxID=475662 RepID=A0A291P6L2_9GAMM|nr:hypothetical protein [Halomonas beimenensis]ATJ82553.1 putative secreted protein [Halomonas beimenensis]